MATHLFRPADPTPAHPSPSWKAWRGLLVVAIVRVLTLLRMITASARARRIAYLVGVALAFALQGVLLLTAAYLVDLALSLMELWAELARKHLELTL